MNDAGLKSLYRRMTRDVDAALPPESASEPLSRAGYPEVEGTPLDRIAASAAHADILRVAMELAPEAESLSREVARLRAPRRAPPARSWLALAAGVGAAAVLIAALRPEIGQRPVAAEPVGSAAIFSVSFESAARDDAAGPESDAPPIFSGGFDS
jgi:hypothetical protein